MSSGAAGDDAEGGAEGRLAAHAAVTPAASAKPSTTSRATFMISPPREATVESRPGAIPPVKRQPMVNNAYQNLVN